MIGVTLSLPDGTFSNPQSESRRGGQHWPDPFALWRRRKEAFGILATSPASPPGQTMTCWMSADGCGDYGNASVGSLVSWAAEGDRRAFDEIVVRHGLFALRVAMRLIADPQAAEDIVQEAMVRAWSQARHFDPERARFTTWLYRIVVNLCIDHRRRVRHDPLPEDFDAIDPAEGAEETMASDERAAALRAALRELPVRQRAAMTLVYDEGLSGAEAARVLCLSAKAVERLLARARAFLRERLQPDRDWKES